MKILIKIVFSAFLMLSFFACKKDKIITDSGAKVRFSQDSVLFDTVFTTIGSSTRNIRVINNNKQRIKISNIQLQSGSLSQFIINVDGQKGTSFADIEIAGNDSVYIFIQVNVNPTASGSPLIISDKIIFNVNGNTQSVALEAWGQDAYYHRPTDAIKFSDGTYLPYSTISAATNTTITWINDKPHVIYGYLVVDSTQKLIINAGVRVYFNYKAGLWVYRFGEIQVKGQKGNEVSFQGARREKDYADEPGQWDRIWINEGSNNNQIDYAIIKNGYIGLQTEILSNTITIGTPGRLKLTNTKIQNMSLWGLYSLAYQVYGANNVISNCQDNSVNLQLGGIYTFIHCTFSNFWEKDKARVKATVNISNYIQGLVSVLDSCYFGNCIIDGKLSNELNLDLNYSSAGNLPKPIFSNCWLKTTNSVATSTTYINVRTGSSLNYKNKASYDFSLPLSETQVKGYTSTQAQIDALKFPNDINGPTSPRNTSSVTVGAYEVN